MASEDVVFSGKRVTVTYQFENTTNREVKMQIGFPETTCGLHYDCAYDNSGLGSTDPPLFHNFETTVRGKSVSWRVGQFRRDSKTISESEHELDFSWVPHIRRVFLFDVTFAPRETVEVVHTYRFEMYDSCGRGTSAHYSFLTKSGALWRGSIGKARFTIRGRRPWEFTYSDPFEVVSYEQQTDGSMELVLEATDWEPTSDFSVGLLHYEFAASEGPRVISGPNNQAIGECPFPPRIWSDYTGHSGDYLDDYLAGYSADQLRLCRNARYARHGRTFQDSALQHIFYGERRNGSAVTVSLPNPHYSSSLLTQEEVQYITLLSTAEQRLRREDPQGEAEAENESEGDEE